MYTLRRWWDRHRFPLISGGLALGAGLALWHTHGSPIAELARLLSFSGQRPTAAKIQESAQFQELQQRVTELESQNQRLQKLMGFLGEQPQDLIPAPVIGRSADQWWQKITLGRGSADRVKVGDVVTAPGGLVGRVEQVSPHTSRVLLLTDPSSKVGVLVSRSRATGMMRGGSELVPRKRAVIEFLEKNPDVRRGDWIATSHLSGLFPMGLAVGRIESFNPNASPAPTAEVELSAPMSALDWVVIKPHQFKEQPVLPPYNPDGVPRSPKPSPKPSGMPNGSASTGGAATSGGTAATDAGTSGQPDAGATPPGR